MPQRPTIVRRVRNWLRNRISSSGREQTQPVSEGRPQPISAEQRHYILAEVHRRIVHERHPAFEQEQRDRQRELGYSRWLERQRWIAYNQRLQTEYQEGPGGPLVYRFQLLELPEELERVNRSLVLTIDENSVRFRLEVVQVDNDHITWAVTVYRLGP